MLMVVLLTLLLMAGILAASLRLSLGSRQNVGDQAATLKAQYAAESGMALAQSRLRDIQKVLSAENLSVPIGTLGSVIKSDAEKFCGNTTWTTTTEGTVTKQTCTAQNSAASDRFSILNRIVKSTAYSALPSTEASGAGSLTWWNSQLGQTVSVGSGDSVAQYKIVPEKVEITGWRYRFYLKLAQINAKGQSGTSTRVTSGQNIDGGGWWFEVSLPSFLDNVLFTNFHKTKSSTAIGFDVQQFDGPIHTNEKFLFYSGATAGFSRKVTSAGCTNLSTLPAGSATCTSTAGAYLGSNTNLATGTTSGAIKTKIDNYTNVSWNNMQAGQPNFFAAYRPMPTTADTQMSDAQSNGLYISSGIKYLELYAGDESGNKPTSYTTTLTWSPAPQYQYIAVTNSSNVKTVYRYDTSKNLQVKAASTWSWSSVKSNFNGVIFVNGLIGFTNSSNKKDGGLIGGGRTATSVTTSTNTTPLSLPALAPFAQITVAATGNIYISGDLPMSQTPRVCSNTDTACIDDSRARQNVLGIYTQSGDIFITESSPINVNLHAMIMTSTGEITVDNYTGVTYRGSVRLLGGLVENYYGGFGSNLSSAYSSDWKGYARDFKYDRRFLDIPGFGPPSYPVSPAWIAEDAVSLDTDRIAGGKLPIRLDNFAWKQGITGDFQ